MKHIFLVSVTILGILLGPLACTPEPEQVADERKPTPVITGVTNGQVLSKNKDDLTAHSINLSGGTSTVPSGLEVSSYTWTKIYGPDANIVSPNGPSTEINGLKKAGDYIFQLTVKSSNGQEKSETVTVTVAPWVKTGTATVTFNDFVAGPTIDFAPKESLPVGVTYILTDDQDGIWNGTDGYVVSAELYNPGGVFFTQTYKRGDVLLSNQSVSVAVAPGMFGNPKSFSSIKMDGAETTTTVITPVELSFDVTVPELP
jgi:hypothetical protein